MIFYNTKEHAISYFLFFRVKMNIFEESYLKNISTPLALKITMFIQRDIIQEHTSNDFMWVPISFTFQ